MKTDMPWKRFAAALVLSGSAALGLLLWSGGSSPLPPPPELQPALYPTPRAIGPFELSASDGAAFGPDRLAGRWTLLFFGYTHCPDICPTTLMSLQSVRQRLENHPEVLADTAFVFVSVDPKRDTPEHLKRYMGFFHPDFLGATGERAQIDRLVEAAGAVYLFEGDTAGDDYLVNHSASIFLVDPRGRFYGRLSPPHEAAEMVETYLQVRRYYEASAN